MISVIQFAVRRPHFRQFRSFACMSTSAMEAEPLKPTVVKISPVLCLHKFNTENENAPVALLLPWATATERALDRFRQLYAERGFNILTAYAQPVHFIWPNSSRPVAAEIVRYLRTQTGTSPIVVHAFSIGAFMYANMLLRVTGDESQEFADLQPRVRGQVFDSIVIGSLLEMRVGTAKMLTPWRPLQLLILKSSGLYFFVTHRHTVVIYDRLVAAFKQNPFKTPILCFYSLQDPMCKTDSIEEFIHSWEPRTQQPAHFRNFPDPKHAGILRAYPEEYRDTLFKYLDTLKLEGGKDSIQCNL